MLSKVIRMLTFSILCLEGCRDTGSVEDTRLPREAAVAVDATTKETRASVDTVPRADRTGPAVTFSGAGDIAWCDPPGIGSGEVTASLLDKIPGAIFSAGDNSNGNGTLAEYTSCFGPSWGRHLSRFRPAPGNHDYLAAMPDGADYHTYFGDKAGPPGKGFYSYELGAWHIVVLNSECTLVSCETGQEQEQWLKSDLAAHSSKCTLAILHRPYFNTTTPSGSSYTRPLWSDFDAAGVDVVVSGHYHWYERFKPQNSSGAIDLNKGIRQFIVGTGGALYMINSDGWAPNSEVHFDNVFGVIRFTLRPDGYDWQFVPEAGKESFTDSGSDVCH
jgi:acid phosphatase type 7